MITVFFDGKCGLCSKEIRHYQKVAPSGRFRWADIASDPAPVEAIGVSQAVALKHLHAQSADGAIHVGVDAFLVIWSALPRWRILGHVIGLPGCYGLAIVLYDWFARRRFERLDHCQTVISSE
jgi:predicted DCC family thiol-disulfide oxidoreductase YuxK